ncbi:MAG: acyltransferase, partial [Myxococcota bacterium]
GGTREGCRSFRHRYTLDWGERHGYLRVALRHRLPIVPAAGHGVDDTYIGLNDGYALGKRLGAPGKMPVWFGLGPFGLWPFSLPFPVRITTRLGAPIHLPEVDPDDHAALSALHARVTGTVQALLEAA